MTSKAILLLVGCAIGCLITLLFRLPWLRPMDTNAAAVLAAMSSTVLAVLGAYWLWRHQVTRRDRDIKAIAVPIFNNFYMALLQVRAFVDLKSSTELHAVIRQAIGVDAEEPTLKELLDYRAEQFESSLAAATREAIIATQQWDGMQDALLSIRPPALGHLVELYRHTRHAIEELPALALRAKPKFLNQIPPVVKQNDRLQLDAVISELAKNLNLLDGGSRKVDGGEAVEAGEPRLNEYLLQSNPLGPTAPPEEANLVRQRRHN